MKKCPYCAEEIKDEAVVCRFCGRNIDEKSLQEAATKKTKSSAVKAFSILFFVIGGLAFGGGLMMDVLNFIFGYDVSLTQTMTMLICAGPSIFIGFILYLISK